MMSEGLKDDQQQSPEIVPIEGGRGEVHRGLKLVSGAVRRKWPIPDEVRARIVKRVATIATSSEDERNVVSAASVLVGMDRVNQADEHLEKKLLLAEKKEQGVTVNVAVGVNVERHLSAADRERQINDILMAEAQRISQGEDHQPIDTQKSSFLPASANGKANGVSGHHEP